MMGALSELQKKGGNMLKEIRMQKEVLQQLERKAEEAETKRKEEEELAKEAENQKQKMEEEIVELQSFKENLELQLSEDETKMTG